MADEPPKYLTTEEAQKRLGLSKYQFRCLVGLDPDSKRPITPFLLHWLRPNTALCGDFMWSAALIDALALIADHWSDVPRTQGAEKKSAQSGKKTSVLPGPAGVGQSPPELEEDS